MNSFFDLIDELESHRHYHCVDEMIKIALDMSDVDGEFVGEGMYGAFYTDFNQEEKRKLKQKLGRIPDDIGIKRYTYPKGDIRLNVGENLAVIYIAPYIKQQTSFKTPEFTGNLSLAGMISNGLIVSQKMPGVNIETAFGDDDDDLGTAFLGHLASDITRQSIEKQLSNIGVVTRDMHSNNFFVQPEQIKKIKEQYESGESIQYDLSEGASLFDFGLMRVKRGTPPGQQLEQLKGKLISKSELGLFKTIIRVIEDMLI